MDYQNQGLRLIRNKRFLKAVLLRFFLLTISDKVVLHKMVMKIQSLAKQEPGLRFIHFETLLLLFTREKAQYLSRTLNTFLQLIY